MHRSGQYRVNLDGEWDIDDLFVLADVLQETYAYFYYLSPDTEIDDHTRSSFVRYFWSSEYAGRSFAQYLYYRIPADNRLRIGSMAYSSPGDITFIGVLSVLFLLSHVVRSWAKTGDAVVGLLERINAFFEKNRLRRPPRHFNAESIKSSHIDEATDFCHEIGRDLGLPEKHVNKLIDLTGNPISALKLLVSVANESRKLLELEDMGKLKLPSEDKD